MKKLLIVPLILLSVLCIGQSRQSKINTADSLLTVVNKIQVKVIKLQKKANECFDKRDKTGDQKYNIKGKKYYNQATPLILRAENLMGIVYDIILDLEIK